MTSPTTSTCADSNSGISNITPSFHAAATTLPGRRFVACRVVYRIGLIQLRTTLLSITLSIRLRACPQIRHDRDEGRFRAAQGRSDEAYLPYVGSDGRRDARKRPHPFGWRPIFRHAALLLPYLE